MRQADRILSVLNSEGYITSLQAFKELGCTRLAARVYDLRGLGHVIESINATRANRWGDKTTFAIYYLPGYEIFAEHAKQVIEIGNGG